VLLNIYFHCIALLLNGDQAFFGFCLVVFVLKLGTHQLEELCAGYLLMVKAVQQKVLDQLYFGTFQGDLTFRWILNGCGDLFSRYVEVFVNISFLKKFTDIYVKLPDFGL